MSRGPCSSHLPARRGGIGGAQRRCMVAGLGSAGGVAFELLKELLRIQAFAKAVPGCPAVHCADAVCPAVTCGGCSCPACPPAVILPEFGFLALIILLLCTAAAFGCGWTLAKCQQPRFQGKGVWGARVNLA